MLNDNDGNVYMRDRDTLAMVRRIGSASERRGGGQVANVGTRVFEELTRQRSLLEAKIG